VKLGEASLQILQLACSAFRCILVHTILITTMMVRPVKDSTRAELADCRKSSSTGLNLDTVLE
jgi:hypothetical protein